MKKLVLFLFTAVLFGSLTSCNMDDDGYSLDNAWVGFGLVHVESNSTSFTILMDDGEVLYPVASGGNWYDLKNNERVLVNFTILGDKNNTNHDEQYYVRINSLRKILYKGIMDIKPSIEDSIGNDPILVRDKWIKNNLLNFELQYRGGNKTHFINLVKQPGEINLANGPVLLELRHNNNNDPERIPLSSVVTFDMSSLKVAGKNSTPFKVVAKGFDGKDFEYSGEYKY
jgi:hypothetical protein